MTTYADTTDKTVDTWKQGAKAVSEQLELLVSTPSLDLVEPVERYFDYLQRAVDLNRELAIRWAELITRLTGTWRDEALRTGALLSREEMAPALGAVRLADGSEPRWPDGQPGGDNLAPGQPVAYGFGWFLDPWRGRKRMWHHGETRGFRSMMQRFTAEGLTVIILANRSDIDLHSLALQIAAREMRP